MIKKTLHLVFILLSLALYNHCTATGKASKADAIAMVKKAGAYYQQYGRQKALAAFNDKNGPFVKNELYLFVYDGNGINLAHGQNPKMVGKNLLEMRDADGLLIIKKVIEIGNSKAGNGWQRYKWPNSLTKEVEEKMSYTEKFGDLYISCGIYP